MGFSSVPAPLPLPGLLSFAHFACLSHSRLLTLIFIQETKLQCVPSRVHVLVYIMYLYIYTHFMSAKLSTVIFSFAARESTQLPHRQNYLFFNLMLIFFTVFLFFYPKALSASTLLCFLLSYTTYIFTLMLIHILLLFLLLILLGILLSLALRRSDDNYHYTHSDLLIYIYNGSVYC